jgi:peptidoglycan/xylan/chitin deacetylase (PgdA/CDA1 family)
MTTPPKFTRRRLVLGAAAIAALAAAACDSRRAGGGGSGASPPTTAPPVPASTIPTTSRPAPRTTTSVNDAAHFVRRARGGSAVALTFHASGDSALATALLDVLAARRTKVTVFGVGQWMAANPTLVARIGDDGHEFGNHTQTHQAMGQLTRSAIAAEISACAKVLEQLTGSMTPWFRPSGIETPTDVILAEAGRAGYATSVGYDVDTLDFQDPGSRAVVTNFRNGVSGGSIVSLHFGHRGTIDALPGMLDHLASTGLQPVTVGQLLA